MKKILFLVFTLPLSIGFAQQDHIYSGEGFSKFVHNPASFAMSKVSSFEVLARKQWIGMSTAPKGFAANWGGRLVVGGKSSKKWIPLIMGFNYEFDQSGFATTHVFNVPLGYPIDFKNSTLTLAVSPGLISVGFTPNWIPPQTTPDPLLPGATRGTSFDLGVGAMWYNEKFFTGFSVTHLTAPYISEVNFSVARHYHLQAGYRFSLGENTLFPIFEAKANGSSFVFQEMTYFMTKDDFFTIGAGYRLGNTILTGVGVQKWNFRLGYNMDIYLGPFGDRLSHELRLSYLVPYAKN